MRLPAILAALVILPAWAGDQCRAVDGDTLRCGRERVRLQGVYAPELRDQGGPEARQRLQERIQAGDVRIAGKVRQGTASDGPKYTPGLGGTEFASADEITRELAEEPVLDRVRAAPRHARGYRSAYRPAMCGSSAPAGIATGAPWGLSTSTGGPFDRATFPRKPAGAHAPGSTAAPQ